VDVDSDDVVSLERDDVVEGKDAVVEAANRWIESRTPRQSGGRWMPCGLW
jgi:hypothetical protein